jgi:hypothetical protein
MLKGASKTRTLGHVRAIDYSLWIVDGMLADVIRLGGSMSKGASKTRTLGHVCAIDYNRIVGGMLVDVIREAPCQKVRQKLGHSNTFAPSITIGLLVECLLTSSKTLHVKRCVKNSDTGTRSRRRLQFGIVGGMLADVIRNAPC